MSRNWNQNAESTYGVTANVSKAVLRFRAWTVSDTEAVVQSVKRTGRALILHEAPRTCGLGAEISAQINEKALFSLEAPVVRVTGQDIAVPLAKSEDYYYPTPERTLQGIKKAMEA